MKICSLCQQEYENPEIRFCGSDGQTLVEQANPGMQSKQQSAAAGRIAAPFSASLAMSFFAHDFGEKTNWYLANGGDPPSGSTNVLCQPNVKVNTIKLAYNLLAIAFWNLRENNLIRFTPGAKQGFIFKSTLVIIELNRANQTTIPGLEFDLLEIIKQSAPGVTVQKVVQQFLGEHSYYPHERVFQRLTQWMIHLGYGQPDTSKKSFFKILNGANMDFELIPDCQRIAGSQQAAQIIHSKWLKFQNEQSEVFNLLYKAVERAVEANTSYLGS